MEQKFYEIRQSDCKDAVNKLEAVWMDIKTQFLVLVEQWAEE